MSTDVSSWNFLGTESRSFSSLGEKESERGEGAKQGGLIVLFAQLSLKRLQPMAQAGK